MKRLKSTVVYTVPSWNFCNSDNLLDGEITKDTCRFCVRSGGGHSCMLYGDALYTNGEFIKKTTACKRATAGFKAVILADNVQEPKKAPDMDPREIIKQTIELYTKTVNDLLKDGYPRQLAESLAKQHILGGK